MFSLSSENLIIPLLEDRGTRVTQLGETTVSVDKINSFSVSLSAYCHSVQINSAQLAQLVDFYYSALLLSSS